MFIVDTGKKSRGDPLALLDINIVFIDILVDVASGGGGSSLGLLALLALLLSGPCGTAS